MLKIIKESINTGVFDPISKSILRVIGWFIQLGVCYLIHLLGWAEIPTAFFAINMVLLILGGLIYLLFSKNIPVKAKIIAYPTALIHGLLPVLAAYIVTSIFTFNFFEIYMLIMLGKCFLDPQKANKK